MLRLGIFVSHPIQYFAPLWRALAAAPELEVLVHFFSDHSVRGGIDQEFGVEVAWDIPVLEGYASRFLSREADLSQPASVRLSDPQRILQEGRFDWVMIHGYSYRFERQVVRTANRLGIATLMRGESTDTKQRTAPWYRRVARDVYLRRFYRHVDRFCYIGEHARQHLLRFGVTPDRMRFSPYAVDTELFEQQYQSLHKAECRRQLGIPDNQLVVLFSGKLIPRKAPLLLLEAIARLHDRERVWVIMLGDGEQRAAVTKQAHGLLGNRALLLGFVNQRHLGSYFRAADVFVLPSMYETWGLVVNEGMQFSLPPLVSSGVGCHPDLVIPGQTGYVFPVGDAAALARDLQRFLDQPALAERLGRAARKRVGLYSSRASVRGVREILHGTC